MDIDKYEKKERNIEKLSIKKLKVISKKDSNSIPLKQVIIFEIIEWLFYGFILFMIYMLLKSIYESI